VNPAARTLAGMALEAGAIRFQPGRPFTWASGFRMPVYNDNRLLLARASSRKAVAEGFAALLREGAIPCEIVAGTATAGIPHATTLADLLGLPLIYVRDKPKEHGLGNQIEGLPSGEDLGGKAVVLVEDLVSTGGSALKAVQAIRESRGRCGVCLAIMSYGFPGSREAFSSLVPPCELKPLLQVGEVLALAAEKGLFSPEETGSLEDWQADPFGWGEKHGFPRVVK
jgi:orotate phosphoribosyltransferase